MPRPGIAYETVRTFIETHTADDGTPPTIAAIIKACGGSATTVTRFRQRYLEESQGIDREVPDALATSIAAGAKALWNDLVDALAVQERELEAGVEARMSEADQRLKDAHSQVLAAEQNARETLSALDESRGALAEEREKSAALLDRLAVTEAALGQANGTIKALESTLTERDAAIAAAETDFQQRIDEERAIAARLARQVDARIEALDADRARAQTESRRSIARLESQITELKQALAGAKDDASALQERRDTLERENAGLLARLAEQDSRIQAIGRDLASERQDLRETRELLTATAADLASAKAAVDGLERSIAASRNAQEAQGRELAALRETNAGLVETLRQFGASETDD